MKLGKKIIYLIVPQLSTDPRGEKLFDNVAFLPSFESFPKDEQPRFATFPK